MNKKVSNTKIKTVVPIIEVKPTAFVTFIIPFALSFIAAIFFFAFIFLFIKNTGMRSTGTPLVSESISKDQYIYGSVLDPYDLIKLLDVKAPITVVDLRPSAEYKKGHIRSAIHYSGETTGERYKRFIAGISKKNNIVFYQYTQFSMKPKQMTEQLKRDGFPAATLAVGWNEWRHFVTMWVPESYWNTFEIENYVEPAKN